MNYSIKRDTRLPSPNTHLVTMYWLCVTHTGLSRTTEASGNLIDEEKWPLVHTYRRCLEQNKVLPILCPDDGTEMVFTPGKELEPALKCFQCHSVFTLGSHVYNQMLYALAGVEIELHE